MDLTDIPVELFLKIISHLNFGDILELWKVSPSLKNIIETNKYYIFLRYKYLNKEINNYFNNKFISSGDNYYTFKNFYMTELKERKTALIVVTYMYKWIVTELFDSPMDRSAILTTMIMAIKTALIKLYPLKEHYIIEKCNIKYKSSHRYFKKFIEEIVSDDLLNAINISRIIIEKFSTNNDKQVIYMFNKNFTKKSLYEIEITNCDKKLFII